MKRILEIINYLMACGNAISKGVQVVHDSWPDSNPFINEAGTNGNS